MRLSKGACTLEISRMPRDFGKRKLGSVRSRTGSAADSLKLLPVYVKPAKYEQNERCRWASPSLLPLGRTHKPKFGDPHNPQVPALRGHLGFVWPR